MQNILVLTVLILCTFIGAGLGALLMHRYARKHRTRLPDLPPIVRTTPLPPLPPMPPKGAPPLAPVLPAVTKPSVLSKPTVTVSTGGEHDEKNSKMDIFIVQLRTYISSMRWFTEMLLFRESGKLSTEQMELLHQISDTSKQSCAVLAKMLDALNLKVDPEDKL